MSDPVICPACHERKAPAGAFCHKCDESFRFLYGLRSEAIVDALEEQGCRCRDCDQVLVMRHHRRSKLDRSEPSMPFLQFSEINDQFTGLLCTACHSRR